MSRVSIAAPHLSAQAVREKMKTARSFWHRQKWLVVYNALVDPRTAEEIAQHTGVSVGTVHKVISEYNRKGSTALSTPGCMRSAASVFNFRTRESIFSNL